MAVTTTTARVGRQSKTKVGEMAQKRLPLGRQLLLQLLCLFIAFTVLFPIAWVVSLSLSPLNVSRPKDFIPANPTFEAYQKVLDKPTTNPVNFLELTINSIKLSAGTSLFAVLVGVSAAYAFSRFKFKGRQFLMLAVLAVLMLPAVATIAPLFTALNRFQFGDFNLRNSLWGVGLAIVSGLLPFSIWNLKGYLDTIPKDLEEAGAIDGATRNQIFTRIVLPLSTPALAVTALFGFIGGWTEYNFSWQFLTNPKDFTLAMALASMSGQYARTTPWSQFSAFAILVAVPVAVVYLALQKYIVSGLTVGGSKG
jgi:arabinogalactan oligomer/maltooligosaccharide transport system permease protein